VSDALAPSSDLTDRTRVLMREEVCVLAQGLEFPEGPVWCADGSLLWVEIKRGTLMRLRPGAQPEVVADLGGGPNGAQIGPDGKCYVCNNGGFKWAVHEGRTVTAGLPDDYSGGRIERVDLATGAVERVCDRVGELELRGPNDLVFDAEGGIYFSDPGKWRGRSIDRGSVFYVKADGTGARELVHPMTIPNGVGLSPDGRTLYCCETETSRLWAWDIARPGVLARLTGQGAPGHGGRLVWAAPGYTRFDSLAVEATGNICLATLDIGAISVVSPTGELIEQVILPCGDTHVTNICFGGNDMKRAFITLSSTGQLVEVAWPRPGLKLNLPR